MYILNSLYQFYEAYQNQTELYYGKNLRFIPKREYFTEESKPIFDFIIKYSEMIEYNRKYNEHSRYYSDSSKYIYVTGNNIETLFEIINKVVVMKNEMDGMQAKLYMLFLT